MQQRNMDSQTFQSCVNALPRAIEFPSFLFQVSLSEHLE
jgi:hypothetical protein